MTVPKELQHLIDRANANGCWHSVVAALSSEGVEFHGATMEEQALYALKEMRSLADEAVEYIFELIMLAGEPIQPMCVDDLDDDYEPSVWDEHRDFPLEEWEYDVRNGDTRQGYWMWVATKIEERDYKDAQSE